MYYVYLHRFTNGVFYIGKGYGKRFFKVSNRNNNFYNNLLKKYGPPIKGIYRDNLTVDQISKSLSMSPGTIKSILSRTRKSIKKQFKL